MKLLNIHLALEIPKGKRKEVAAMLRAIHAQEDRAAARQKASDVAKKLEKLDYAVIFGGIKQQQYMER